MRRGSFLILVRLLLTLLLAFPAASQSTNRKGRGISAHDRELLSVAISQGQTSIMVLLATVPGSVSSVASEIQKLGGVIRFRDDDIGYVRAFIPTGRAEDTAGLPGVEAFKLDELVPVDIPKSEVGNEVSATPPTPLTPPLNPYLPTQDIGAPQFVQENPTYDGRGVKIAIVDTGVDLLTPELQSAKALDGTAVPKIVEWVNFNDPLSNMDPSWVNMNIHVRVSGGSFLVNSAEYTGVASDGDYRFGIFDEGSIHPDSAYTPANPYPYANYEYLIRVGDKWCADLNRNNVCHEQFAVLWRTSDNTVWVDSDADRSFAGEIAMTDYKVKHDFGLFGTDDPATTNVRESVPFVIQTDGKDKFVNIGIVGFSHATHVAGIAAGKGFFGGAFDGAAPEAQIISVRACLFYNSCTSHGLLEGMIYAAKQAGADVINMSIGGLPALNDGNNAAAILYNRLIEQTKTQMFFSAGNSGPGVNSVGEPSVATLVMSIGAYVSRATYASLFNNTADKNDGLFVFSSRGPAENGGLKPNIVAPGSAISSIPGWQPAKPPGWPYSQVYPLTGGYGLMQGTSMAAPQATGGAALLISAAKQAGAQYKPDQLRQAINSSARFLDFYAAHDQGNGLFQVGAAWELLQANIKTAGITSAAPVNTILSPFLEVSDSGPGIHQREEWAVGDSRQISILFTRTQGTSKPVRYDLSWTGNDGSFSIGQDSILLPQDVTVALNLSVSVSTAGAHSAILNLDDPSNPGIEYQALNTVIAAEDFTPAQGFALTKMVTVPRLDKVSLFFRVPENTPALRLEIPIPQFTFASVSLYHPWGVPWLSASGISLPPTASAISKTLAKPEPGVWELVITGSNLLSPSPTTLQVKASILGASISPELWTIDPGESGQTYSQIFQFTNNYADFLGKETGTQLGSAFQSRGSIATGQQNPYLISVPPGTSRILARIRKPSDIAADLDLYLLDCTSGPCVLRSSSGNSNSDEEVGFGNPAPGTWLALVVSYAIPAGFTEFDYMDVLFSPAYGKISFPSSVQEIHPYSSTWSLDAEVTVNGAPPPERPLLVGFVNSVGSDGTIFGQAEVDVKF